MCESSSVTDDEILYRRVPPGKNYYVIDGETVRFSSQAFTDSALKPSVDRAKLNASNPQLTKQTPTDGVAVIVAGEVRNISEVVQKNNKGEVITKHVIDVIHVPIEGNLAHAEIVASPKYANERVFKRLIEGLARLASKRGWAAPPDAQFSEQ